MLELKNITKDYLAGDSTVHALRGINVAFRPNEFVAVLGPSGCGKTTLLNLIGGLDQYTDGDLLIAGRSTKKFKDRDWDTYRNHSIGFVFQSYNLIPHQTVLANVELALTLSGVSRRERRQRAVQALEKVGLGDQLKKKPNQMSGGQMQRVAIARALVNDPEILLADEPTGALDSETSVQVMEILKEISKEKLIIMVTHNPELADQYASRIVRLLDGSIISDSNPYEPETEAIADTKKQEHTSMSFFTALGLSLNNLMTKKARTILTAFAGSIGIIGIALILSLSNGIQNYIDKVQEDTLSSYPITIEAETLDMSSMVTSMMGVNAENGESGEHELDAVYSNTIMYDLISNLSSTETRKNDLNSFKNYLEDENSSVRDYISAIQYRYNLGMTIYAKDIDDKIFKSDVSDLLQQCMGALYGGDYSSYFDQFGAAYSRMEVWEEMLPPQSREDDKLVNELLTEQYDLLYGAWPQNYDEAVLIVNKDNEISDLVIYCLGLGSQDDVVDTMKKMMNGEQLDSFQESWSYEDICNMRFKIVLPAEFYQYDSLTGTYSDISTTDAGMDFLYNSDTIGTTVKIVGILRPNEDAVSSMMSGAIGYTSALTDYLIDKTQDIEILQKQQDDPETDVILGLPFLTDDYFISDEQKKADISEYLTTLSAAERADIYTAMMSVPSEDYLSTIVSQQMDGLSRETIEEQVIDTYATQMNVDAATVSSYIAQMDDETLFGYVEESIREQVSQQYAAGVQAQLAAMSSDDLSSALELAMSMDPADEIPEAPAEQVSADPAALAGMDPAALAGMDPAALAGMDPAAMAGMDPAALAAMNAEAASAMQPAAPTVKAVTDEQYVWLYDNFMPAVVSDGSYDDNMKLLGAVDYGSPKSINIYAATFSDKDAIADAIKAYNDTVDEDSAISYTDYVALLMSSITTIINAISYVLIAFVSISLVVSSIMIGIITYISVLERTKEIGILRAIGASKRDISRVFNAETLIEGLIAGAIGIGLTLLLIIPINIIVQHLTGISSLGAELPPQAGVILVIISMILTFIAGLIPSSIAARKDPVVALRTE